MTGHDHGACATPHPAGAAPAGGVDGARRAVLARRVRLLVAATIGYKAVAAAIAIPAGEFASSTALLSFGLDSVIEVGSAAAVAWQFAGADHDRREQTALRLIAASFFAMAGYVGVESALALVGGEVADHSPIGIGLAALSVLVMPALFYAKRATGRELGSASVVADSKQSLLCVYLSAVLLIGLLLNAVFGLSWADPVAALVIAAVAVREGLQTLRGEHCC